MDHESQRSSPQPTALQSSSQLASSQSASSQSASPQKSRIISKILSPAVRLWLRSQVESIEELHVHIEGGDRQILSGNIPKVTVSARSVMYQGIALSDIYLVGEQICVNLGDVLKRKPLRLLHVVPVQLEATLQQSDVDTSLNSSLLTNALTELFLTLLRSDVAADLPGELRSIVQTLHTHSAQTNSREAIGLQAPTISLGNNHLTLGGILKTPDQQTIPVALQTGLHLVEGRTIRLHQPKWISTNADRSPIPLAHLHGFEIDLGSEVCIHHLALEHGQLVCRGRINVVP